MFSWTKPRRWVESREKSKMLLFDNIYKNCDFPEDIVKIIMGYAWAEPVTTIYELPVGSRERVENNKIFTFNYLKIEVRDCKNLELLGVKEFESKKFLKDIYESFFLDFENDNLYFITNELKFYIDTLICNVNVFKNDYFSLPGKTFIHFYENQQIYYYDEKVNDTIEYYPNFGYSFSPNGNFLIMHCRTGDGYHQQIMNRVTRNTLKIAYEFSYYSQGFITKSDHIIKFCWIDNENILYKNMQESCAIIQFNGERMKILALRWLGKCVSINSNGDGNYSLTRKCDSPIYMKIKLKKLLKEEDKLKEKNDEVRLIALNRRIEKLLKKKESYSKYQTIFFNIANKKSNRSLTIYSKNNIDYSSPGNIFCRLRYKFVSIRCIT